MCKTDEISVDNCYFYNLENTDIQLCLYKHEWKDSFIAIKFHDKIYQITQNELKTADLLTSPEPNKTIIAGFFSCEPHEKLLFISISYKQVDRQFKEYISELKKKGNLL